MRELRSSNLLFYCLFYFLFCSSSSRSRRVSRSRSKSSSRNERSRSSPSKRPSVLCPFGGQEYYGIGAPFSPNLHQQPSVNTKQAAVIYPDCAKRSPRSSPPLRFAVAIPSLSLSPPPHPPFLKWTLSLLCCPGNVLNIYRAMMFHGKCLKKYR
jgi:hypothetical protein